MAKKRKRNNKTGWGGKGGKKHSTHMLGRDVDAIELGVKPHEEGWTERTTDKATEI